MAPPAALVPLSSQCTAAVSGHRKSCVQLSSIAAVKRGSGKADLLPQHQAYRDDEVTVPQVAAGE